MNHSFSRNSIVITLFISLTTVGITLGQEQKASISPASLKKLSIEALMDVEVTTVSRKPEKLTNAASAIQVITKEEIRRSGASTLPEILRLATNLQVAQVNASQWAISARGFNNVLANKLLVMIDGRTVYTPLYAGVFWDVQNELPDNIERIEVISGPGGTLWGANAVNGVINIVTSSAKDTQGILAEGGVGNELRGYGSLRYGGKISDHLHYRVNAMGMKRDGAVNMTGEDVDDAWTIAQGGLRVDWTKNDDEIMLLGNVFDNRPNPDALTPVAASGHNVVTRWNRKLSESSDFRLQVYYDRTVRDFRNGFAEQLNTYDIDGQHRFSPLPNHEVIWGFGYRLMDHQVDNLELFRFDPEDKKLHLYNLFIQDRISFLDERLQFTLGAKLEHNSYTNFQFQPSARVSMHITNQQVVWAAVSRAVRNPARIDTDFSIGLTPEVKLIEGNRDFGSEAVTSYELGWKLQTQNRFTIALNTFYNSYRNLRSAEPGPAPLFVPITFANGVEGNTYGLEFSGTYQPLKWWRIRGGYTFLEKDLKIKSWSNDLNEGSVESNDPGHQFLLQSMMDISDNVEFGLISRFVDDLPDPKVPSYWAFDARVAYRIKSFIELSVNAQNLFNDDHLEFIPSSPEQRAIQRSVYGKVAINF